MAWTFAQRTNIMFIKVQYWRQNVMLLWIIFRIARVYNYILSD